MDSPNVLVGLDRVQLYMLFFLFRKKKKLSGSLDWEMGNVIGLTPSRMGIAIGRLVNAQLRHMPGSKCACCAEA